MVSKATGKTTKTKSKAAKPRATKKTAEAKKPARSRTTRKSLVIVESPAKARTVGQILGNKYHVTASLGHVRDLPKSKLGVDIEQDFQPSYLVMRDKRSILKELKQAGETATDIYLATDPDREGEAISWHLQAAAGWDQRSQPPKRVVFHEITREAVNEAFQHPREIDMQLVNAQQARRILDRLVGYQISPLLWRRVQRGLSAGRVQSAALRIVVDRDREIAAFVPEEYWTLEAQLHRVTDPPDKLEMFTATLHSLKGKRERLTIPNGDTAHRYQEELKDATYTVTSVRKRQVRQRPAAPFTTSTLQQEAGRKLRFTPQRTMMVAQQLYEGISVSQEGHVGLITYMRTDSTSVAQSAVEEARQYILERYGQDYLPEQVRVYRTRSKTAQEAHEAIRPTSVRRDPEYLKFYLTSEQYRLYNLIWSRMVACQMADALSEATTVDIEAVGKGSSNVYIFRATGSVLKFPGFRTLYLESRDDDADDDSRKTLPELTEQDALNCIKLDSLQHFTQPPPRYTEATLIKAMEAKGIGRPSTYAPTIGTLLDRHYVEKEQNRLMATTLGITVTDMLTEYFSDVIDLDFTARMEEELDEVASGDRQWVPMLHEFYAPFEQSLETAHKEMPVVKLEEETDEVCDKCGRPMVIKMGRFGRFIACTGFPECRNTKPILNKVGVACPRCGGDIVERRSRGRRRPFYGCSNYPECEFIVNSRPVATLCPECGGLMVEEGRDQVTCTECHWKGELPEPQEQARKQELAPVGD